MAESRALRRLMPTVRDHFIQMFVTREEDKSNPNRLQCYAIAWENVHCHGCAYREPCSEETEAVKAFESAVILEEKDSEKMPKLNDENYQGKSDAKSDPNVRACFGDLMSLVMKNFAKCRECPYEEECMALLGKDHKETVIIIEETDPNECACFGYDFEGYCEVICRLGPECGAHTDQENDFLGCVVIIREME